MQTIYRARFYQHHEEQSVEHSEKESFKHKKKRYIFLFFIISSFPFFPFVYRTISPLLLFFIVIKKKVILSLHSFLHSIIFFFSLNSIE
jgi:hypothetical protein